MFQATPEYPEPFAKPSDKWRQMRLSNTVLSNTVLSNTVLSTTVMYATSLYRGS